MTAENGAQTPQLRLLADDLDLGAAGVSRFDQLEAAAEQVDRLQRQLQATGPSAELAERLSVLVNDQADELSRVQAKLRNLTAMCDLAEWSATITGDDCAPAVLVSDLRRAIAVEQPAITEGGS
jgi:hypothetical protein